MDSNFDIIKYPLENRAEHEKQIMSNKKNIIDFLNRSLIEAL